MLQEFDCVIYPRKLWVATSWEDVKNKFVCYKNNDKPIEEDDSGDAYTYSYIMHKKSKKYGTLILFILEGEILGSKMVGLIAHESLHSANAIFNELGIEYGLTHDEHAAYMVGWVAKCCWEVLQKVIYEKEK